MEKPLAPWLFDANGRRIVVGDTLTWLERGCLNTGLVVEAELYQDGMRVKSRSLHSLWKSVDDIKVWAR